MNYKESAKILEKVNKAKRILLNCHRGPDPDSIGSALSMYHVLKGMGKDVDIICPTKLDERMNFLQNFDEIQGEVDFSKFDFSLYDLFIVLDSSNWDMVSGDINAKVADIPICVIDHHVTNTRFGKINLVDAKESSVGELLYQVCEDWRVKFDKILATSLLTAIIGDTGIFSYTNTTSKTLQRASNLMENKADKNKIIYQLYHCYDENTIKFVGEILKRVEIDKRYKFTWVAIPARIYKKYSRPSEGKELAISIFANSIIDTKFGIVILQKDKNVYSVSFRSRDEGVDVSKIAATLGGGGHEVAAGCGESLKGYEFEKAVKIVIKEARRFSKEYL